MKKIHFGLSVILSAALAFQCAAPVFAENSVWSTNDIVNSVEHRCGGNVTDAVALVSEEEQAEIAKGIEAAWDEYESREIRASYKSTSYDYTSDYLYKQMDSESKAIYKELDDACSKLLTETADITFAVNVSYNNTVSPYYVVHTFEFDSADLNKMKAVTSAFYYANPQYFFIGMLAWSSNAGYLLTYDGYENGQKRIDAAKKIDSIAANWYKDINAGADVLEKEAIMYKKICDNVTYHYDSSGNPVSEDSNQTIAGALLNETCVCNGYAMTVTYFSHMLGIECIGVVSVDHAWNRIKLNGKWYDLDTTWMDGYEETGTYWYAYCNKGENIFETQDESGSHIVQEVTYTNLELPERSDDMPLHIELTAADASDGSVKLSWEWISDAEEYGVYRYTNSNIYAIGSTLSTSYEVENPVKGDGYFVRAKIKNVNTGEYVWSAYTNGSIAYPPSALVEEKPEITAAIAGDGQVGLNWTAVDGASKYAVYTYLNGTYTCVASRTGTGMYVTGLTNGTKYGFLVRAYVNGKWTSFTSSDIVYATPESAAKPEITAAIAGDGQVGLNWTAVDGASKYAVYTYLNGTYTCVGSRTGTGMYVTGLTNGTKYGFLVRAYVNGKWTSFTSSDIAYATPNAAVNTAALVDELIAAMNEVRTQNSLSSLSKSDELCQQAAAKLEEMSGWGGTNTSITLQGSYQIVGTGDVDDLIARILEKDTSNKNMLNAAYTKAGAAYDAQINGWVIYFE